jgi:hypothetical protein
MKQEDTTHFEVWLSAYESRLVELKQGKAPAPKKPAEKPASETEAQPPQRP